MVRIHVIHDANFDIGIIQRLRAKNKFRRIHPVNIAKSGDQMAAGHIYTVQPEILEFRKHPRRGEATDIPFQQADIINHLGGSL